MTAEDPPPEVVDGSGKLCVALLLELRERIQGLPGGTVVQVIATDPAAPLDLPAWCHLTGHQYLGPVGTAGLLTFALRLAETPHPTTPGRPWHTH